MNSRTFVLLGAALAVACTAALAQTPVNPKSSGEITVKLEFENIRTGCRLASYQPEVTLDGRIVSWRPPSFSYVYDTGNPTTRGQALTISNLPEGAHEIRVALPSDTCPGYGWLPSDRRTLTLSALNRYRATGG